MGTLIARSVK